MLSMAVERMQGEGQVTTVSSTVAAAVKAQITATQSGSYKSFLDRLDEAVSAVTRKTSVPTGECLTQCLLSRENEMQAGDSLLAKSQVLSLATSGFDRSSKAQNAALALQERPATSPKGDNDLNDATEGPAIGLPSKTDRAASGPTILPAGTIGTNKVPDERGVAGKSLKIIPLADMKKADGKKAAQMKNYEAPDLEGNLGLADSLHASILPVALSADATINSRVVSTDTPRLGMVRINESAAGKDTEAKIAGSSTSAVTVPDLVNADTPNTSVSYASDSQQSFQQHLPSGKTAISMSVRDSRGESTVTDVCVAGAAGSLGLSQVANTVIHGVVATIPSGIDKVMNPVHSAQSISEGAPVSQSDSFTSGIASTSFQVGSQAPESTLNATPTALEIGMPHGTHGWLKVRAEMENGAVTASLSSGTATGREMLHRELPALTAFMHQEKLVVNALVVKDAGASVSGGSGDGTGSHQQERPHNQSSAADGGSAGNHSPSKSLDAVTTLDAASTMENDSLPSQSGTTAKGGSLNVVA